MLTVVTHNGESYAWLRSLPRGSADALITDPPYSSGGSFRSDRTPTSGGKYLRGEAPEPDFFGDNRDGRGFLAWATVWLSEAHAVLRDGSPVCLFTDWRQLPTMTDALQAGGFIWRGLAVWDKTEGVRPMKGRFSSQCEYVVWGSKGVMPIERGVGCLPGVRRERSPPMRLRHHQTAKPVDVMSWVCGITKPGGTIIDPFMGSGSTGVAAVTLGYQFMGCEMSEHYCNVATERIQMSLAGREMVKAKQQENQVSLFGVSQ
jgi:site-specific DNA-methyltransferase (adenine-specific)